MLLLKLLIITTVSSLLVKFLIKHSHKLNLVDVPNERSHHCHIIPSGAGISFISVILLGIMSLEFSIFMSYWYIFAAILIVFIVGVIDDRNNASARMKFIFIFAATILLWLNGLSIDTLGLWYGYNLSLAPVIALFISLFSLSGLTNALNLIDGLDGLASSISLVILLFFTIIGLEYHSDIIVILSTFTMAGIIGFLFFNWHPAKIFMGDSGSLTLGFIMSILATLSLQYVHPVALLYLVAMPVLDTLVVMLRRIVRKKSPFSPDKTHIHHIMVKFFNMNVQTTVLFLVVLQIIFSLIGYLILEFINKNIGTNIPLLALIGFILMFILFYMLFTGIKRRQKLVDQVK